LRRILTPEGLFIHDRNSGLCVFTPEVKSKTWTKPLYAQIALTEKCNQKCWWCYSSSSLEKAQSWPLEELKKIIGFLDSWGILGIAFGGGEPFMHPHLERIAMWTWNHTGLDVSVTTNGTAASKQQIDRLEGYVSEVRVSIRNPEACRLLKKFLRKRFELGVNLLLFRGNAPVLESIVDRSMRLGVRDFLVNSFAAVGRGATYRDREPKREDLVKLGMIIQKFRDEIMFKVSGRLAAKLKAYADLEYIPFEDEGKGRIIALTTDRKVKPSSLSQESYPFTKPAEIPEIYAGFITGGGLDASNLM